MTRLPVRLPGRGGSACALAAALAVAIAACSDSTGPTGGAVADVTLGAAQFQLYTGNTVPGAFHFPAAGAAGAQYLVVAQFATPTPDVSSAFNLVGSVTAPLAAAAAQPRLAAESPAQRFHDNLRRAEARLVASSRSAEGRRPLAAAGAQPAPATITPPVAGTKRTFKVCGNLDCTPPLTNVTATAKIVGAHAALYLDDSLPAGGFTVSDLQQLAAQFETDLYAIDRNAFGAESDVDSNGVVIILLTPKVNALVSKAACTTSFVTGFFYGADLEPSVRAQYNNGEVFYGFVPDPAGTVSCAHSVSDVRQLVAVTFIHEFQHMISFNQHALVRNGDVEVLWLNEALSHLAEELGGRHYDSLGIGSTASQFYIGDLYNAYQFLANPSGVAMVTDVGPGDLAQRGGAWLFVRYLVDRFGAGIPHALVNTAALGGANIAAATATGFPTLLGRWALAAYTSDLPGFTPPAELRYETWHFRTTFASLHTQDVQDFPVAFPLVPAAATGSTVSLAGTLRSGSGSYVVVTQAANAAGFALAFRPGVASFPASAGAQLAVVRLR